MVNIDHNPLLAEVELVRTQGPAHNKYSMTAEIITVDNQAKHQFSKVIKLDTLRDIQNNTSDVLMLSGMISAGVYTKRIYPFQNNLDIVLTIIPITERAERPAYLKPRITRYTAVLLDRLDGNLNQNAQTAVTEEMLDLADTIEVEFQLIPKAIELLRAIEIGVIIRQTTVEEALKALLSKEITRLQLDAKTAITNVDVVPANNQLPREHIVIRENTRLLDLPDYLQENAGGFYSAGVGNYILDNSWYIFPLYDTSRLNKTKHTLTFVNLPTGKFPGLDATYRRNASNTVILVTGRSKLVNVAQQRQQDQGAGVRFSNANRFMDGYGETKDNKTHLQRNNLNNEMVVTDRSDQMKMARISKTPIHSNPFKELSSLAARNGSIVHCVWENGNIELLVPGTTCQFIYQDGPILKTLKGCLLFAHEYLHLLGTGMMQVNYGSVIHITLFVNNVHDTTNKT